MPALLSVGAALRVENLPQRGSVRARAPAFPSMTGWRSVPVRSANCALKAKMSGWTASETVNVDRFSAPCGRHSGLVQLPLAVRRGSLFSRVRFPNHAVRSRVWPSHWQYTRGGAGDRGGRLRRPVASVRLAETAVVCSRLVRFIEANSHALLDSVLTGCEKASGPRDRTSRREAFPAFLFSSSSSRREGQRRYKVLVKKRTVEPLPLRASRGRQLCRPRPRATRKLSTTRASRPPRRVLSAVALNDVAMEQKGPRLRARRVGANTFKEARPSLRSRRRRSRRDQFLACACVAVTQSDYEAARTTKNENEMRDGFEQRERRRTTTDEKVSVRVPPLHQVSTPTCAPYSAADLSREDHSIWSNKSDPPRLVESRRGSMARLVSPAARPLGHRKRRPNDNVLRRPEVDLRARRVANPDCQVGREVPPLDDWAARGREGGGRSAQLVGVSSRSGPTERAGFALASGRGQRALDREDGRDLRPDGNARAWRAVRRVGLSEAARPQVRQLRDDAVRVEQSRDALDRERDVLAVERWRDEESVALDFDLHHRPDVTLCKRRRPLVSKERSTLETVRKDTPPSGRVHSPAAPPRTSRSAAAVSSARAAAVIPRLLFLTAGDVNLAVSALVRREALGRADVLGAGSANGSARERSYSPSSSARCCDPPNAPPRGVVGVIGTAACSLAGRTHVRGSSMPYMPTSSSTTPRYVSRSRAPSPGYCAAGDR